MRLEIGAFMAQSKMVLLKQYNQISLFFDMLRKIEMEVFIIAFILKVFLP